MTVNLAQTAAVDGVAITSIQVWTLVIAVVAALAACFAAVTAMRSDRLSSDRHRTMVDIIRAEAVEQANSDHARDRDHVTERYQELLVKLHEFHRTYVDYIEPNLLHSPSPDAHDAYARINGAIGELVTVALRTQLVARHRARPVIAALFQVQTSVMVPIPGANGIPLIAFERAHTEREYSTALLSMLVKATRADLGLLEAAEEGLLIMEMKRTGVFNGVVTDRSLASGRETDELRDILLSYGVATIKGADHQYFIDPGLMRPFQANHPGLSGVLHALVIQDREWVGLAVRSDLLEAEIHSVLDRVVRNIESGLRDDPYWDLPDGARAFAYRAA